MSERDGYVHGVPCWVATIQPDPEAGAAFDGKLFGWDGERQTSSAGGKPMGSKSPGAT